MVWGQRSNQPRVTWYRLFDLESSSEDFLPDSTSGGKKERKKKVRKHSMEIQRYSCDKDSLPQCVREIANQVYFLRLAVYDPFTTMGSACPTTVVSVSMRTSSIIPL